MKRNPYTYHISAIASIIVIWEIIFFVTFYFAYDYYTSKSVFRFEYESVLYLLIAVPFFSGIILFNAHWQNKAIHKFSSTRNFALMLPEKSSFILLLRWFLRRNALAFLIITLSNPQFGKDKMEGVSEGIEIIFALDVSNSMQAKDLSSSRSRLSIAKKSISRFVDKLHGDKVGLLLFAGSSYIPTPLTTDYSNFKGNLNRVSTNYISNQGTAIGNAIQTALERFDYENGVNKAIVIVSDGETHDSNALLMAEKAKDKGVKIFTIGAGTTKGSPIPLYRNGVKTGYLKDENGETVLSKINPDMLAQIAASGGGKYEQVEGSLINFDALLSEINEIEKTSVETTAYYNYIDQYFLFLVISLILIMLDQFLPRLFQLIIDKVIEGRKEDA